MKYLILFLIFIGSLIYLGVMAGSVDSKCREFGYYKGYLEMANWEIRKICEKKGEIANLDRLLQ